MKKMLCALLAPLMIIFLSAGAIPSGEEVTMSEWYLYDTAGVLDESEDADIEAYLNKISNEYDIGVYIATVEDYTEYTNGDLTQCAYNLFEGTDFGHSADRNGVFLLISTNDDSFVVISNGPAGNYVFSDDVLADLAGKVADSYGSDWYEIFHDFAEDCEDYLYVKAADIPYETDSGEDGNSDGENGYSGDYSNTFVYDTAGLLTDSELQTIENRLSGISNQYECGVYIVTVYDYTDYTDGSVYDCATAIYSTAGFGYGAGKDGVMLLLSMADRDYSLITHGYGGNEVFTDSAMSAIEDRFLDNFAENDWYGGFSDYAGNCERMLRLADEGTPYGTMGSGTKIAISIGAACIISGIACAIMRGKMKSVYTARTAEKYAVGGGLDLRRSSDIFTHTTQSRVKVTSESRSSGGGGGGGYSGHSGKF